MDAPTGLVLPPWIGAASCRHGPMLYPARDVYVGRSLAVYGEYSPAEAVLFRQLVQPGDVVVEAGANIGALTIPLGRMVGPSGRVLAFEPQRGIFNLLTANVVLNGLDQIWAERVALGAESGEIAVPALSLSRQANFGGVSLGAAEGEPCPVRTLDSYGLTALKLLKIDVEGSEAGVIAGAERTIQTLRPILYVENDRREKSAALIAAIIALDYRLWWHTPRLFVSDNYRQVAENVFGNISSVNMLCLPRESTITVTGQTEITSPETPLPF
ncbi:FkbM family methyltransferase [Magnetospirillum fulvum]|uniref:Methyltransferase, FkbM family n=1 Tax=Magnetospirillum fulvum TaxID=1082 RepID=A0A1H6HNM9_MAGFU|nr:FkbM family methyltransferase [Magnetospirillum fulvum]SEH37437.1 methyltransferase, FkbM family [Magnetospirillum fulvum]